MHQAAAAHLRARRDGSRQSGVERFGRSETARRCGLVIARVRKLCSLTILRPSSAGPAGPRCRKIRAFLSSAWPPRDKRAACRITQAFAGAVSAGVMPLAWPARKGGALRPASRPPPARTAEDSGQRCWQLAAVAKGATAAGNCQSVRTKRCTLCIIKVM